MAYTFDLQTGQKWSTLPAYAIQLWNHCVLLLQSVSVIKSSILPLPIKHGDHTGMLPALFSEALAQKNSALNLLQPADLSPHFQFFSVSVIDNCTFCINTHCGAIFQVISGPVRNAFCGGFSGSGKDGP